MLGLGEDAAPSCGALAALIRQEILERGPIRFDRFMELALYHPQYGYYRRKDRDPFGKRGDFYTASQLQPVFGRLIARAVRALRAEMNEPKDFLVVELGAGRGEMGEALQEFRYVPIEVGSEMPENFTGVVFSNEFFDALPVRVVERRGKKWHERLVTVSDQGFTFVTGDVTDFGSDRFEEQQTITEVHDASLASMKKIAGCLKSGFVLTIDYGYTAREALRFPHGTLMSYRLHAASEDVLADPGERDITSHVPFDALKKAGEACGLETVRFEMMSQFLLRVGESDQFAEAVRGGGENALKTLIYGMGESFRVLLQKKNVEMNLDTAR
jgi:SAM-dependent MidA family methyltransferase